MHKLFANAPRRIFQIVDTNERIGVSRDQTHRFLLSGSCKRVMFLVGVGKETPKLAG